MTKEFSNWTQCHYNGINPLKGLLDLGAQLLRLGETKMEGFGLANANFEPCLYSIDVNGCIKKGSKINQT
jgi:hypothetical protein